MMNYLAKIQTGINYIEAHLDEEITLAQIAREASLSLWHFQRIFKALSNETVKSYIRSRRMAGALDMLNNSDSAILDIALIAGYETHESFTRAFKSAFDLTPNEYRKLGRKNLFLKKLEINADYLRHIHQHVSLRPEIHTQRPMSLVGLKTCFYGTGSEKNNISDKLPALWASFLPRLAEISHTIGGVCYGVVQQLADDDDELVYFAAIEVSEINDIPPGMDSIQIPASSYAVFRHQGDARLLDNTVNYIYSNWLLNSGQRHTSGPDLEIYDAAYIADSDLSVMHYAIPVS